ncbi:hypothetical protein NDU88_009506 [Pleurodeles waltl]|uniref:Uncharacterized protein n=1 Tax=Pleurodeles waltl TaxID=8319 RepID=A0AAV7PZL6_PLEWA|nr:hypothetical protein NDU88_009506 [Pleurodeles waltl]
MARWQTGETSFLVIRPYRLVSTSSALPDAEFDCAPTEWNLRSPRDLSWWVGSGCNHCARPYCETHEVGPAPWEEDQGPTRAFPKMMAPLDGLGADQIVVMPPDLMLLRALEMGLRGHPQSAQ